MGLIFKPQITGYFVGQPQSKNYDVFAQCLTDKGVVMYGASWCTHCKKQKEAFGSSFQYVKYIECSVQTGQQGQAEECDAAGITSYPSWVFNGGKKLEGELSFNELAKISGCELPK